jgi:ATP-dependent Zn protease
MSDWLQGFVNGLPILLLLGLWLYFVRKMKTGNWQKLQSKQIELLEAQLVTLRQTNELLKTLAEAK